MIQNQTNNPAADENETAGEQRIAEVITALTGEVEAQTEHVELLAAQIEALKVCDRAGYPLLHERHETLLSDAEDRSFRFRLLLSASPVQGSLQNEMETWPSAEREQAQELCSRLKSIGEEVNALSERNSVLLRGELSLIAFQMNLILSAARQDDSYARTGLNRTIQASRLLNSVA